MDNIDKRVNEPTESLERLRKFDDSMELVKKNMPPQKTIPELNTKWEWYDPTSIRLLYQ